MSQEAPAEDNNSADIALGRFGREPAARSGSSSPDPDVLSAATAVQRWEMDHSHSKRASRSTAAEVPAEAAGGLSLHRPMRPGEFHYRNPCKRNLSDSRAQMVLYRVAEYTIPQAIAKTLQCC